MATRYTKRCCLVGSDVLDAPSRQCRFEWQNVLILLNSQTFCFSKNDLAPRRVGDVAPYRVRTARASVATPLNFNLYTKGRPRGLPLLYFLL